jgi:hypothetical protein
MTEETPEQTEHRLLKVIATAGFEVLPGLYAFEAMPEGPRQARPEALACVRDDEVWSQLAPAAEGTAAPLFKIFTFHFDQRFDATGFVGWLHSRLTRATGTGSIVVCGRDRRGTSDHVRGAIFDYWGCPAERADAAIAETRSLIERGESL